MMSFTSCFSSSVVSKCFGGDGTDRKRLFLRLDSSLTVLVSSLVLLAGGQLFLFSTISLLLLRSPLTALVTWVAGVASRLWLLLSTVAQNFLNFLCRYFESFVVLVKVDVDEMIAGVAGAAACSWSFADFSTSTFVRLGMTGVFLANERLCRSSFRPPGSSEAQRESEEISDLWVNLI